MNDPLLTGRLLIMAICACVKQMELVLVVKFKSELINGRQIQKQFENEGSGRELDRLQEAVCGVALPEKGERASVLV